MPAATVSSPAPSVHVAGRDIHYNEFGQGPALLMLHGGGPGASGLSNYSRNIDALAKHFRVLVPDLPGYGLSSKSVDFTNPFNDLASAMLGFLDAMEIDTVHIVGNSLGGATALAMALQAPARVERLVLMGPGGVGISQNAPTDGLKALLTYYLGEGPTLDKLRKFIREYLVFDGNLVDESLIVARYAASVDPQVVANPPLRPPADPAAFKRLDFLLDDRLRQLPQPTLVLWGSEDRVNPPSGALALQQQIPSCDVHLYARTGHWVQWERAEEFNATVAAFLGAQA